MSFFLTGVLMTASLHVETSLVVRICGSSTKLASRSSSSISSRVRSPGSLGCLDDGVGANSVPGV